VPLVRVPWLDPGIVMKMLDAGAYGVICPMINSAEEARRLVAACRYPPDGQRSFGPIRALLYAGADYATHANDTVLSLAMIETRDGLDNLEEIAAVEGLDGFYVGPSDLSLALGCTPKLDQEEAPVVEAIDRIVRVAKENGKAAGIHNMTPEYALKMIDKGYSFVTIGSDARLMVTATQDVLGKMRGSKKAVEGVY
jgi:4-hydroxy-2-oxoheptanedioate aldolase